MNWDTNELDNWIINDEGLYNIALNLYDRSNGEVTAQEAEDELLHVVLTDDRMNDIDYSEIDWYEIAESINNIHS